MIGCDAAQRHAFGFFGIADERGHFVSRPQQRVKNRRPDVPGSPGQKDPH